MSLSVTPDKPEVRIGLVLYGGVSLATYIHGVTLEFLRLVRASQQEEKNGYTELLDATNVSATVDIISGTSAGGINGVALAKALSTGTNLTALTKVWEDKADLLDLLHSPGDDKPHSLLGEEKYGELIRDVLDKLDIDADGAANALSPRKPLIGVLDLFVTATDLNGRILESHDGLDRTLKTRDFRRTFQLKYRQKGYNPLDKDLGYIQNDFSRDRNADLALVCRATSAYPVAFRPVLMQRGQGNDKLFLPNETSTVCFSDGGILTGKPFSETVKAIFARAAAHPVDRILFFVEPDPEKFEDNVPASHNQEPNFLNVAMKAVSGIPMYQSIGNDLASISDRNERVMRFKGMVESVEKFIEKNANRELFGIRAAGDSASEVWLSYQELKISEVRSRLEKIFLETVSVIDTETANRARAAFTSQLDARAPVNTAQEKISFLEAFDNQYRVRKYYRLIEILESISFQLSPSKPREQLASLEYELWAHLDKARDLEWRCWTVQEEGWFRKELKAIAELAADKKVPAADLEESIGEFLTKAHDKLFAEFQVLSTAGAATAENIDKTLNSVEDLPARAKKSIPKDGFLGTFKDFEYQDTFLYPLSQLADLGERDPINLVRISPRDATYISKEEDDKMAGDTLFHFGGFLKKSWRQNDILWGRMDAAETICRSLLKAAEENDRSFALGAKRKGSRKTLDDLLPIIQREIAIQALPKSVTSRPDFDYKAYLEENQVVGEETLESVPAPYWAKVADQGSAVLGNMFRTVEHDVHENEFFRKIMGHCAGGVGLARGLVGPVAYTVLVPDTPRGRLAAMVLFGMFSWGILTLFLMALGPVNFNPRLAGWAIVFVLPLFLYSWIRRGWWFTAIVGGIFAILVLLATVWYGLAR